MRGVIDGGAGDLPYADGPLFGRAEAAGQVFAALVSGPERLVTLVGAGGVGKTRLSVEVAHEVQSCLEDGIAYVPLGGVGDPADVPAAIANALRVTGSSDIAPIRAVIRALQDREMLIVLDNFEHVLAASSFVSELVRECPQLRVLLSSRLALDVDGERVIEIEPLAIPDQVDVGSDVDLIGLAEVPSVALFLARACAANSSFALSAANAETLVATCRRLGGSPLKLELAAARTGLLSLSQILERLSEDPLGVLSRGLPAEPEHHRSLRETIQWSYDLLEPGDQMALAQLSVFEHSFTVDGAAAVLERDPVDVLDVLDVLIHAHLVQRGPVEGAVPRLMMPMAVRDFAREQLRINGKFDVVYNRMVAHFVAWGALAAAALETAEEQAWLNRIEPELDQLRAVLAHLRAHDVTVGLRLAVDLGPFWLHRGLLNDGRRHLAPGLDPELAADLDPALRADVGVWEARLAADQGVISDRDGADAMLRRLEGGLASARERGDIDGQMRCIDFLSHVWLLHIDDTAPGKAITSDGIGLAREYGNTWWLAHLLQRAAVYARFDDDLDAAVTFAAEAWELARDLGSDRLLLHTGLTALQLPETDRIDGLPSFVELQRVAERIRDHRYAANVMVSWGVEELFAGNLESAARNFLDTVEVAQASAYWHAIGYSFVATAAFAAVAGDHAMCARMHGAGRETMPIIRRSIPPAYFEIYLDLIAGSRDAYGAEGFDRLGDDAAGLGWDSNTRVARAYLMEHVKREDIPLLRPRERELLVLIARGLSNRQIAATTGLSENTIEGYLKRAYRQIGVRSRTEAALWALEHFGAKAAR